MLMTCKRCLLAMLLFSNCIFPSHVDRYTSKFKTLVRSECLFRYDEPVSPHLAAQVHSSQSVGSLKFINRTPLMIELRYHLMKYLSILLPTEFEHRRKA